MRIVEKLVGRYWLTCQMEDIKKGDRFRMADDGGVVTDGFGKTQWTASEDAYLNKEGVWTVNVQECT